MKIQRLVLVVLDAIMVALALYGGYLLRFDFEVPTRDYRQYMLAAPVYVVVRLLLFWRFNLYRGILRYASTGELLAIVMSATLGSCFVSAANLFVIPFVPVIEGFPDHDNHLQRIPWQVVINEFVFTMLLVGGSRFARRLMLAGFFRPVNGEKLRKVLIVGAGDAGEAVARQMKHALVRDYDPVAFVDDDRYKLHSRIHSIPVAGTTSQIPAVIARYEVQDVLVAIPRVTPDKLREIIALCENARVRFKILPSVQDVFSGRVSINQIRAVEIEDLLGRDEVRLDLSDAQNYVAGETVIVTGAGGSIGAELCRQLLHLKPRRLLLMGHGENSIYEIAAELEADPNRAPLHTIIGDIRDEAKVRAVVEEFHPAIFFHAAAHKHVPLMEMHPDEAVKNNITGTLNMARAADLVGARKFILISSDKAVRPTSVMGATKRAAEMIIFCMARTSRTQFVAVRFGNVLGSRGSVIPHFKRQIARGGPVTITHPEVTRFFMTIPEAVALVIHAGAVNEQRRLYLLDMGSPVKIVDLARNLIRLSGFEPGEEIQISYTGLRPGEKLTEELLTAGENVKATGIGKIFVTEPDDVDASQLWKWVEDVQRLAAVPDARGVREKLRDLIPDYGASTVNEQAVQADN